jgi:hypothetical protein
MLKTVRMRVRPIIHTAVLTTVLISPASTPSLMSRAVRAMMIWFVATARNRKTWEAISERRDP